MRLVESRKRCLIYVGIGAIQQAKSGETSSAYYGTRTGNNIAVNPSHNRTNIYVNPNYKPSNRGHAPATTYRRAAPRQPAADLSQKDVLIGGVTFQSSGRSLVRKDCEHILTV